MKNKLLVVVLILAISSSAYSQMRVVALHSPGSVQYFGETQANFQPFLLAYAAAVDGDTIYMGGGNYDAPDTFNKKLTIYGAGHYPSATVATQPTTFNNSFSLGDLADNSHFEGINFVGAVYFAHSTKVDKVTFKRCLFNNVFSAETSAQNYGVNNVFVENVFKSTLELSNVRSSQFYNNMIFGNISNATGNIFINNNFMVLNHGWWNEGWLINYANQCVFNNNIFCRSHTNICLSGTNVWNNNIFHLNPNLGLNPIVQNSVLMDPTTVFVNYTANTNFDYAQDYKLTATALTHLGTDGTQRGVYGGANPYKENSVPVIPHISNATISPQSANGQINVNIQVKAQPR